MKKLVTHHSFNKMISNCVKEIVIKSLLVFSFRLKYHNCFNLLQSIYFPSLTLFFFLSLELSSVAPWHCPFKIEWLGASLVAQWLRICLPMQGTGVRALVWEDPTCRGATKPVRHNY